LTRPKTFNVERNWNRISNNDSGGIAWDADLGGVRPRPGARLARQTGSTSVRSPAPALETATETYAVSQTRLTCGCTAPPSTIHSLILQAENNTIILVSTSMICLELHAHGYGVGGRGIVWRELVVRWRGGNKLGVSVGQHHTNFWLAMSQTTCFCHKYRVTSVVTALSVASILKKRLITICGLSSPQLDRKT